MQRFISNSNFAKCTDQDVLPRVAEAWITGFPFSDILQILAAPDVRIGDRKPTINHAVDICEGGLGFEGMLIIGAVADNFEALRGDAAETPELLRRLQWHPIQPLQRSGEVDSGTSQAWAARRRDYCDEVVFGKSGSNSLA